MKWGVFMNISLDDIYIGFRSSEYYNQEFDDYELYIGVVLLKKENFSLNVDHEKKVELYSDINTKESLCLNLEGEIVNSSLDSYGFIDNIEKLKDFFDKVSNMKLDNDFKVYIALEYKEILNKISNKEKISSKLLSWLVNDIAKLYVAYLNIDDNYEKIEDENQSKEKMGKLLDFNLYKSKLRGR